MQSDDRPLFSLIKYINSCKQFSIPSLQWCSQGAAEQCTPKTAQKEPKAATHPPNNSHSNLIDDSQQAQFH